MRNGGVNTLMLYSLRGGCRGPVGVMGRDRPKRSTGTWTRPSGCPVWKPSAVVWSSPARTPRRSEGPGRLWIDQPPSPSSSYQHSEMAEMETSSGGSSERRTDRPCDQRILVSAPDSSGCLIGCWALAGLDGVGSPGQDGFSHFEPCLRQTC